MKTLAWKLAKILSQPDARYEAAARLAIDSIFDELVAESKEAACSCSESGEMTWASPEYLRLFGHRKACPANDHLNGICLLTTQRGIGKIKITRHPVYCPLREHCLLARYTRLEVLGQPDPRDALRALA